MEHIITCRLDTEDYNNLLVIRQYLETENQKIFNSKIDITLSETIRSCIRRTMYAIESKI